MAVFTYLVVNRHLGLNSAKMKTGVGGSGVMEEQIPHEQFEMAHEEVN